MDSSLEYYEVTFWVSFYGHFLMSILSDMSLATLAFFSYPFAWKICFQPFTFSLTAWMELESIMLSEISQAVKDKYHMISPISGT